MRLDRTYGFVVLQGDHHTIGIGKLENYEVLVEKSVRIANKHGRGGQSQNRFARLAEESRVMHLKLIFDRLDDLYLDEEGQCLVEKVIIAGPGPMKLQLLEHVPKKWVAFIDPNPVTLDHIGITGLRDLTEMLADRCRTVSKREEQLERERLRKEERKEVKGQQRGGGRKERQEEARERKRREIEERLEKERREKEQE